LKPSLNWLLACVPLAVAMRYVAPLHNEVVAVSAAVLVVVQMSGDGESNWLEGALLLAVYLVLATLFFFLPEPR
jgi:calcium/proton exchanger cax